MPGDNAGLFGQLQQSLGSVIELFRVRLALLGTELGLEKQRLAAGLFWGATAFMCLTVAVVLFCGFVILLLWDSYRLAAVGVLALLFLGGGLFLLQMAQRRLSAESNLFSTSLAELERDRAAFTAPASNEPQ
ncbi:phage holin family protein [Rhodoferax sp.]|uniref:phage holin family protein n=1 Tax=Rhodoferax sp. TaxID=50421 RepID=UPI0025DFF9C4|nr:phage holin family protein [Rhodoferax sp.]MCM2297158.1 phage holin family protein [Rhodoferax sp.]